MILPAFLRRPLFCSCQRVFQPQNHGVQKTELAYQPRQPVDEYQAADEQKQRAAKYFDGVKILSEALIELQELPDSERSQQKRNGQARGINGQKQDAAGDGVAGGGESQHGGENRPDARGPPEGKRKAEKKAAPDARLRAGAAQVNVAIEPAGHRWSEKSDHGKREKVNRAQTGDERPAAQKSDYANHRQHRSEDESRADAQLDQQAQQ